MDIFPLVLFLSLILVILGMILIVIDVLRSRERGESRVGGVVIVGPVPIIIGNDRSLIRWAVILSIVAILVTLVLVLLPYLVRL